MSTIVPPQPGATVKDDRELLQAYLAGDERAFAELVSRHRNRLWGVAMNRMRNPQDAEDALQDALLSVARKAGSYRGEAAVSTWLYRVVENACFDRLRRKKPTVPLPEYEIPEGRDEHTRAEIRLDVHAALAQLSEDQRRAIVLVDMEQFSVADAAQILGVPEGTVKSRCWRGRLALSQILGPKSSG